MQIKVLTNCVGDVFTWNTGDIVNVSESDGQRMIDSQIGELVVDARPVPEAPESKRKAKQETR